MWSVALSRCFLSLNISLKTQFSVDVLSNIGFLALSLSLARPLSFFSFTMFLTLVCLLSCHSLYKATGSACNLPPSRIVHVSSSHFQASLQKLQLLPKRYK